MASRTRSFFDQLIPIQSLRHHPIVGTLLVVEDNVAYHFGPRSIREGGRLRSKYSFLGDFAREYASQKNIDFIVLVSPPPPCIII